MSLVQLQEELKKLSAQEKLALADYLVMQAGETAELTSSPSFWFVGAEFGQQLNPMLGSVSPADFTSFPRNTDALG